VVAVDLQLSCKPQPSVVSTRLLFQEHPPSHHLLVLRRASLLIVTGSACCSQVCGVHHANAGSRDIWFCTEYSATWTGYASFISFNSTQVVLLSFHCTRLVNIAVASRRFAAIEVRNHAWRLLNQHLKEEEQFHWCSHMCKHQYRYHPIIHFLPDLASNCFHWRELTIHEFFRPTLLVASSNQCIALWTIRLLQTLFHSPPHNITHALQPLLVATQTSNYKSLMHIASRLVHTIPFLPLLSSGTIWVQHII